MCLWWVGELKQRSDSHMGQLFGTQEKHLRLRVKQLTCGSPNGMRVRQSLPQPQLPRTGMWVPYKAQQLGAGDRDGSAIPGGGLLLTAKTQWEVREAITVRKACGGKPGSHGGKVILLSHT